MGARAFLALWPGYERDPNDEQEPSEDALIAAIRLSEGVELLEVIANLMRKAWFK